LDGDLVVARIGATTGKAWLVRQPPEAVFASYLIRIRPRPGVDARFLAAFFDSDDYRAQINASKGGRLKGGVNIENLNSLLVPVLSETPQAELVERIDRIDTCLVATRRVREALAAVFDASLQALLGRNR
jgi:type I restriction enzyme S subunit